MKNPDRVLSTFARTHDHRLAIQYAKDQTSDFACLCDVLGRDKGTLDPKTRPARMPLHMFADFYDLIFEHRRDAVSHVLECGIGLNNPNHPATMPGFGGQSFIPSQMDKIRILRDMIGDRDIDLEVDGGIKPDTAKQVVAAGANVLVAGSAVFTGEAADYANNITALRG